MELVGGKLIAKSIGCFSNSMQMYGKVMTMSKRFTSRCKESIRLARQNAIENGDSFVDDYHLLASLTKNNNDTSGLRILKNLNVDISKVNKAVQQESLKHPEDKYFRRDAFADEKEIPFCHNLTTVITSATEIAGSCNKDHVGTEHLLLALVRDGKNTSKILEQLDVDCKQVFTEAEKISEISRAKDEEFIFNLVEDICRKRRIGFLGYQESVDRIKEILEIE